MPSGTWWNGCLSMVKIAIFGMIAARAAGDVLAFAAMTLRLQQGFALGHILHRAAIASPFELHDVLPVLIALQYLQARRALPIAF
jgi:hypothetical protein